MDSEGRVSFTLNGKRYAGIWLQQNGSIEGYEVSGTTPIWAPFVLTPAAN
jgi:hypothetical protein